MSFITGAIIFIAGFVIGIFVAALMTAGGVMNGEKGFCW